MFYCVTVVPTATAENVQAEPFNATACYVQWEPVSDTVENLKGKLGGYRVSTREPLFSDQEQHFGGLNRRVIK